MARQHFLGVDIGSVSVAVARISSEDPAFVWQYRFHQGRIVETLRDLIERLDIRDNVPIALTASSPPLVHGAVAVDWLASHIEWHTRVFPAEKSLLIVGGERFALVRFDEGGAYRSSRGNSGCAAGTGGFLDQQSRRLGLSGPAELAELALANTGGRPKVASRCSVFAKTDLIHAQQEGYRLEEICDGLCEGLARNLVDTLIAGELPPGPVVAAGGVARNRAVMGYVEHYTGRPVLSPEWAGSFAALGAAGSLARVWAEGDRSGLAAHGEEPVARVSTLSRERSYHYAPLEEPRSYPDFAAHRSYTVEPAGFSLTVEVDDYRPGVQDASSAASEVVAAESGADGRPYLGFDIGSTSTKAVVTDSAGTPRFAFYTRTAGKPLRAVQALLAVMEEVGAVGARPAGVATTGSGRRFIGGIVGADLVLDEITAHARAAVELDPKVDTIIEIGGQDAKFTTLRRGRVTFSQMNSVCAAGTGSFLEEQASRLQVSVGDYAQACMGTSSPMASDRCTVFMERDINHYLNTGYTTSEILTAALHSVRENYLQKVAEPASIGRHVCFQGATAKNRALVAAFEQALGRPIAVSRYCHVTGAWGAALTCRDERLGRKEHLPSPVPHHGVAMASAETAFRGLQIARQEIPVRTERCDLCNNHCRIRIAEVGGEEVAFGFLCGRDYETKSFVPTNTSGFDLMRTRRRILRSLYDLPTPSGDLPVLGIPTGLHMAQEEGFFRRLFSELGIPTRVAGAGPEVLASGKKLEGAEFCTPMAVFHGQLEELLSSCDLVFAPVLLEDRERRPGRRRGPVRQYCYYTQFSAQVVGGAVAPADRRRILSPLLAGEVAEAAGRLYEALSPHYTLDADAVREAWARAAAAREEIAARLRDVFEDVRAEPAFSGNPDVVILGRPYTAMDPDMNKGIPGIFEKNGVRPFFQDMLPAVDPTPEVGRLLSGIHWRYAATILSAADLVSRSPGLYPVLVTSFKCAPDAFCIEHFKRIMDSRGKPYLILQLDEHDSNVGYETRIEAAIRAFRNHHEEASRPPAVAADGGLIAGPAGAGYHAPHFARSLRGRTLLLPNWDPITVPLLAAHLRGAGIPALALPTSEESIRRSMRHNSGQCIPVNVIAEDAMDYVRGSGRSPSEFVVWMIKADWSCGIPLYPHFISSVFRKEGLGELGVYVGDLTYMDLAPRAAVGTYFAYQFGGWLRSLACSIRPYEIEAGRTDEVLWRAHRRLVRVFENRGNRRFELQRAVDEFAAIPVRRTPKPKVAIFGDLYVRDNEVFNRNLIGVIEAAGGEAVTTPYSDYVKIIASAHFARLRRTNDVAGTAKYRLLAGAIDRLERRYQRMVEPLLGPPIPWSRPGHERDLARFGMVLEQHGESFENALKILYLVERHRDLALFVQASPAFCCPSMVTESLGELIEETTGIPIVTVNYDGTETDKNAAVVPYIRFPRRVLAAGGAGAGGGGELRGCG